MWSKHAQEKCEFSTARGFFNFPPIPVGNKTEWKDLKILPLCDSTHFGGNTAMKTQVFFSGALNGIAEG